MESKKKKDLPDFTLNEAKKIKRAEMA